MRTYEDNILRLLYEGDEIREENLSQDRRINLVGLNSHKPEAATKSAL